MRPTATREISPGWALASAMIASGPVSSATLSFGSVNSISPRPFLPCTKSGTASPSRSPRGTAAPLYTGAAKPKRSFMYSALRVVVSRLALPKPVTTASKSTSGLNSSSSSATASSIPISVSKITFFKSAPFAATRERKTQSASASLSLQNWPVRRSHRCRCPDAAAQSQRSPGHLILRS